jgi:hypothetical protein
MIERTIDWCNENRFLVFLAVATLSLAGIWSLNRIPLDALPDIFARFRGRGRGSDADFVLHVLPALHRGQSHTSPLTHRRPTLSAEAGGGHYLRGA